MLTVDAQTRDGRVGRVFLRSDSLPKPGAADALLDQTFETQEDRLRHAAIQLELSGDAASVDVHPTAGVPEACAIYLRPAAPEEAPMFCAVVVSRRQLGVMLKEADIVVETAALQVHDRMDTGLDLAAAFEAWLARVLPSVPKLREVRVEFLEEEVPLEADTFEVEWANVEALEREVLVNVVSAPYKDTAA